MAILAPLLARAGEPTVEFKFSGEPRWVADANGFSGSVRISGLDTIARVSIAVDYPGGRTETAIAEADKSDANVFHFKAPAAPGTGPGEVKYRVIAAYGPNGGSTKESPVRTLPLSLFKELDITGDAAIELPFPIGGPAYMVRYIPCCNIFGGMTTAERVPVNPAESGEGLPEKLLSDFVVLKPDGLSASTMGLFFDFVLGPDRFKGITPALYEFNGRTWNEFHGYEVDTATGRISVHCPQGGTLVVGVKLARSK